MGLTKREVQEVTWKLKRADREQRFTFLDAMDVNPTADEVFEQLKDQKLVCKGCGVADEFHKYGTTSDGTQRYYCTACGRTFVEDWNQPTYASSHAEETWKAFFERMIDGKPLVELAHEFGLCLRTAHKWRHKLLRAVRKLQDVELAGRVWVDETYLSKNNIGPKPGDRPDNYDGDVPDTKAQAVSEVSEDEDDPTTQTAILTGMDSFGRSFLIPIAKDGGSADDVGASLGRRINSEHSTLVSDGAGNFASFAREQDMSHVTYDSDDHDNELQAIDYLHSNFKQWIRNFRGVSSDYLPNYCALYQFIKKRRQANPLRN